jgi:hypothetical protein
MPNLTQSYLFDPTLIETFDEAFERVGIDPETLSSRHITSARRSLGLLLKSSAHLKSIFTVRTEIHALTSGQTTITLNAGAIDVMSGMVRDNALDVILALMGREEYLEIPDKTLTGRPDRLWVDRQLAATPTGYVWQIPDSEIYSLVLNVLYYISDPQGLGDTLPVPEYAQEWLTAALATKLAVKYAPERMGMLRALEKSALKDFKEADVEDSAVTFSLGHGRRRRR